MSATQPLLIVGDASAESCVGEFCGVPSHREQVAVNHAVDSDGV